MDPSTHSGDPELWLDAHGDALYAFAMLRVRDPAAAEDLVQESLLAGLTGIGTFAGRADPRTWLIGILKYKILDYLRRRGREPVRSHEGEPAAGEEWRGKFDDTGHWVVAPANWGDPAEVAENDALGRALHACIERLPEKLRTLFVLREIDGLGTEDLRELLGISSANNLWVMLSRARERLRLCLQREWFAEA